MYTYYTVHGQSILLASGVSRCKSIAWVAVVMQPADITFNYISLLGLQILQTIFHEACQDLMHTSLPFIFLVT